MFDWYNNLDDVARGAIGSLGMFVAWIVLWKVLNWFTRPAPCKTPANQLPLMSKDRCPKCGNGASVGKTYCRGCRKIVGEHLHRWCQWGCKAHWCEQCYVEKPANAR